MRRLVLIAATMLALNAAPVHAAGRYTTEDTERAIQAAAAETGVSAAFLERVVRCESGLRPDALGDVGHSHGAVQLSDLPTGLLGHFYAVGYRDADDPYQAVMYLARAARGDWAQDHVSAARWSCA